MWAVIECWRSAKLHPTADLQRAAGPVSRLIAAHNTHRLRAATQTTHRLRAATQTATSLHSLLQHTLLLCPTLRLNYKIVTGRGLMKYIVKQMVVNKDFLGCN